MLSFYLDHGDPGEDLFNEEDTESSIAKVIQDSSEDEEDQATGIGVVATLGKALLNHHKDMPDRNSLISLILHCYII